MSNVKRVYKIVLTIPADGIAKEAAGHFLARSMESAFVTEARRTGLRTPFEQLSLAAAVALITEEVVHE